MTPIIPLRTAVYAGTTLGGFCAGLFTWFLWFGTEAAFPHEATLTAAKPQGWSYPFSCCSGYDCREVPDSAISERPEGYVIKGTGEVIAYTDKRIKESPDGVMHWCSVAGANDGKTICLFVPTRGF